MQNHSITLPEFFQNGMIFQRGKEIRIFGQALPGAEITAAFYETDHSGADSDFSLSKTAGDSLLSGTASADKDGHFLLTMPPLPAAENLSLSLSVRGVDELPIFLNDISFGDIWLAGGQSNMEFFLKYDQDFEAVQKLPGNPKIHMYNVPQRAFAGHNTHNKTGYGYWFRDNDTAVSVFSAPAYSFAREIQASTGVPIGIIGCNWGGSTASAWVPESVLQKEPLSIYLKEYEEAANAMPADAQKEASLTGWAFEETDQHQKDFEPLMYGMERKDQFVYMKEHAEDPVVPMGPYNMNRPGGLYHHMLSTLIPFSIKGVLWYQGETDAETKADIYDQLLTALIGDWRSEWRDDFPFLLVQLAPFGKWLSCNSKNYAIIRQKQELVAHTVPDVFLTGIMDLGSYYDIHPKQKMEVGRRLALLARGHVYGEPLLCDAPEAISAILEKDGTIHISFKNAEGLSLGNGPSEFLISSDSSLAHAIKPTAVQVSGTEVILTVDTHESLLTSASSETSGGLSRNLTVTLADQDYAEIHLQNQAGLTALPFHLPVERR